MRDRFENKIREIYKDRSEDILKNLVISAKESFRINTLKTDINGVLTSLHQTGFDITRGPFDNTFINNSKQPLSSTKEFDEGSLYIQGLSSIYDVLVLSPSERDSVLDLCAAPGSKTSLIAQLTNNKSNIVAVENNSKRYFQMIANLKIQGVNNVKTLLGRATLIPYKNQELTNYFDKVLVDVPCSNEGSIREIDTFDFSRWTYKLAKKLPMLQKKIAAAGISMLKPGGTLVYSTCTYSIEENEEVVSWILKKFRNMHLVEIPKPMKNMISGIGMPETLRILPDSLFDAFFIAKFQKDS